MLIALQMMQRRWDEESRRKSYCDDFERDRRMKEMFEEEDRRKRARKEAERVLKKMKYDEDERRRRKEYEKAVEKDPWDYQFLPEGWSIFGQRYIQPINEHGYSKEIGGYYD